MKYHINPSANVKTNLWTGYKPLEKDFKNLVHTPLGKKGGEFSGHAQSHNEPERMASRNAPSCSGFTRLIG